MFQHQQRRLYLLFLGQLLFTASFSIDLTLTGLVGFQLAPEKALATLPYALITLTACLTTFFASLLMGRIGRRRGFVLGGCAGLAGGIMSFYAVGNSSFLLFCCGTASVGIFQAFAQYYRLAAADSASTDAERTHRIGFVLFGGVIASLIGPPLAYIGNGLLPKTPHAGAYLIVALLAGLSAALMLGLGRDEVRPSPSPRKPQRYTLPPLDGENRRLYGLAVATSAFSYSVMMVLMSITPIHLLQLGDDVGLVSAVMMAHLFAMFATAPLSSRLYARLGWQGGIAIGGGLILIVILLNSFMGTFYGLCLSLFLLGMGWNILFVTGSTLLVHAVPEPEHRPTAQGLSEFATALCTAISCFLGGVCLNHMGWLAVNTIACAALLSFLLLAYLAHNTVKRFTER